MVAFPSLGDGEGSVQASLHVNAFVADGHRLTHWVPIIFGFWKGGTLVKHVDWEGRELSFISDFFLPRAQQTQNQPEHSTCKTELLDKGN